MSEALTGLVIFFCLVGASLGSLFTYERLPARHRQDDTQTIVRLVAGIFVVMTSLVLGLMVNSAKNTYEAIDQDVHAFATNLILLDRMLLEYGPEADEARHLLLGYAQRAAHDAAAAQWVSDDPVLIGDRTSEKMLNDVADSLRGIHPPDAERIALGNEARQQYRKVVELRWSLLGRSQGTVPLPLLILVVTWLMLIFASFGYRAPRNLTIVATFLAAAGLIAGSLYLVLDMDSPFSGAIQVSAEPLQRAIAEMR